MEYTFSRNGDDLEHDHQLVDADVEHAQDCSDAATTTASAACTADGERGYGSDHHAAVYPDAGRNGDAEWRHHYFQLCVDADRWTQYIYYYDCFIGIHHSDEPGS